MTTEFKEAVSNGQFKPTEAAYEIEDRVKARFGLTNRYEPARLFIGRSMAIPQAPPLLAEGFKHGKYIPGQHLFGPEIDLWIAALLLDGGFKTGTPMETFRAWVEAHWARGAGLMKDEMDKAGDDESRLISQLADFLPAAGKAPGTGHRARQGTSGEIRLKVGSVSTLHDPDNAKAHGAPVDFVINGPGASPHIALMGRTRSGKTTAGVQIALEAAQLSGAPILFIDPKGEFVNDGRLDGAFATAKSDATPIQVGRQPLPLDFLPGPGADQVAVQNATMKLRDSICLCSGSAGAIQKDMLCDAIEGVIQGGGRRDLEAIRDAYEHQLTIAGKDPDSVSSRLNELTRFACFKPDMPPADFFAKSWVISLNTIESEDLKRLVILMLLDATSTYVIGQKDSPLVSGHRTLTQFLVIDEARSILLEKKYESLSQLIRKGASKGLSVILLSQDPSDFDGKADDFTTQLGTVISFACNQSQKGLRTLESVFGRKLQSAEFTDQTLPVGVAFCKLPLDPHAKRVLCWTPAAQS